MRTLRENWQTCLIILACWGIVGLFPNGMYFLRGVYEGRDRDFWQIIFGCFAAYGLWGLLSLPLVGLCGKYPLDGPAWRRQLPVYFLALPVFGLLHISGGTVANFFFRSGSETPPTLFEVFRNQLFMYSHFEFLAFGVVGGGVYAFRYYRRAKERELEAAAAALSAARLEATLREAQLNALKSQLHPHFLFNALNTISVLMTENVETANRMLIELSELLRMALRNDTNETALRDEIEFLETYLRIEQLRFHDRLKVAIEVDPAALAARVPHLILQPIVENAVKHGVSARQGIGEVEISITRERETLRLAVRDNGIGFRTSPGKSGGIGLKNTRRRLARMYPDAHEIQITEAPGCGTLVVIEIPYLTVSLN